MTNRCAFVFKDGHLAARPEKHGEFAAIIRAMDKERGTLSSRSHTRELLILLVVCFLGSLVGGRVGSQLGVSMALCDAYGVPFTGFQNTPTPMDACAMIGAGIQGMFAGMLGLFVGPMCTLVVPTRKVRLPGKIIVCVSMPLLVLGLAYCWLN